MRFKWNTPHESYDIHDIASDIAKCIRLDVLKEGSTHEEIIDCLKEHNASEVAIEMCERTLEAHTEHMKRVNNGELD